MATVLPQDDYLEPLVGEADVAVLDAPIAMEPIQKLLSLAESRGDISNAWSEGDLNRLGQQCVEDYQRDKAEREDWEKIVLKAQESAAQEKRGEKNYPWKGASNVQYPLLTVAALQFNARAYPAIVKGDEAISVKVVGSDKGRPQMGPQGPVMQTQPGEDGQPQPVMGVDGQPQPVWLVQPGEKGKRASRVKDYLNTVLFYRMDDWEADTDALLIMLPVDGCAFRKVWYSPQDEQQHAALVSALRIIVPVGAKSCATTPRLTEEVPDTFPYQIVERQRAGIYREVVLEPGSDDDQKPRLLIEQHRLIDLDDDGLPEPYVVTVDVNTQKVLRVEANFSSRDVKVAEDGRVLRIERGKFFIKYDFFPHPQGKFYGIGLGHLLEQMGSVIDTAINQMLDAGHAQIAGGGFIASGLRLQSNGRARGDMRYQPGVWRTVDASGGAIRDGIVDRTAPQPSPVMIQILDMMLAASRDISSIKDVITGEASNNGQVGTTLALIEQGLQVFTAIYKRVYRSLREEYALLFDNIRKFGGERAASDYAEVLDDPEADFDRDFQADDMDIRPVSDPQSVTKMQAVAKAQFIGAVDAANPNVLDKREAVKRQLEAADIDDIDKLMPPPPPPSGPTPDVIAKANRDQAAAHKASAEATKIEQETVPLAFNNGMVMGAQGADANGGGLPGMAGGPGDPMGVPGDPALQGLAA
jgi:chaperonin GroES